MKNYKITLKNGRKLECRTEQELNLQNLNNFSTFVELKSIEGIKYIFAKDEIETVRIEEIEESKTDKMDSASKRGLFSACDDRLTLTEEQRDKLFKVNRQPVWDYRLGCLRFE